MDREKFLKDRQNYIGASDAAAIMGASIWRSPYDLWEDKLGLSKPSPTNWAQQRGIDMEPEARDAYIFITGTVVKAKQVFHPTIPYMMANLDGMSNDGLLAVEIKCPGEPDHELARNQIVPEKYMPQLQHQLAVTDHAVLHYASYRDGECLILEVPRDDRYIKQLYLEERKFWDYVENLTPPPLTDKDFVKRDDLEWLRASSAWMPIHLERKEAEKHLKEIKEKEDIARDVLIMLAGERNCSGSGIKLQRILKKGSVDYKSVPELEGVDLEKYRKDNVTSWRVTSCSQE